VTPHSSQGRDNHGLVPEWAGSEGKSQARPTVLFVLGVDGPEAAQILAVLRRALPCLDTASRMVSLAPGGAAACDAGGANAAAPPRVQAEPPAATAEPPLDFAHELLLEGLLELMRQAREERDRSLIWRSKTQWFERSGVTRQRRDTQATVNELVSLGLVEARLRGKHRLCYTLTPRGVECAEALQSRRRGAI
jgi:hypothetical protein